MEQILKDRFLKQIEKTNTCWLWKGFVKEEGYGALFRKKKEYKAHRVSWEIYFGEIPKGLIVCHKCDVRNCVNPDHLFLGTYADNNKDRALKKRSANPIWCIPKLDKDQKKKLVQEYINGKSQRFLAKEYNISQRLVWNIINPEKLLIQRQKYGK